MSYRFIHRIYLTGFFIILASLFYYQVIRGQYYLERAKKNYVKVLPLLSIRGSIFDRNAVAIACDQPTFNIAVVPFQIKNRKNALFEKLSNELDYSHNLLDKNYKSELINFFAPANIIFDLDKETALRVVEKFNNDILLNSEPQRSYPYAYEFSHLLGYVKKASAFYERLKKYGYLPLERAGFLGIEQYYDSYLKGEDGGKLIEVNAQGKVVGFLGQRLAQRGQDIYLTIDSRIQQLAYNTLKPKKGVIILMDSEKGEIISLVSYPSFDLNKFTKGKDIEKIFKNSAKPLFNRAIQAVFPLGSTFKPLIAAAALEEGKITPTTTFNCAAEFKIGLAKFKCREAHNDEDLYDALVHSCNIYFYNVGLTLGAESIAKWAKNFGLNSLADIDLPHEKKGFVPSPSWKKKILKEPWFSGDTVNFSIGQGYIEATPLETLLAINVFANGGYLAKPYILKRIGSADSSFLTNKYAGISQDNIKIIKQGLIGAVEREDGTASSLKKLNLRLAGKTGTAQNKGKPHGWFVGFFPHNQPKYSICVFIENGGSSYEALRVTYNFLKQLQENGLI